MEKIAYCIFWIAFSFLVGMAIHEAHDKTNNMWPIISVIILLGVKELSKDVVYFVISKK